MLRWLFLFFIALPLIDLYLLFRIAQSVGALWVLLWVVLTAVVGVRLAHLEGFRVLLNWQRDLAQGRMPQEGVFSSLLVLVGGLLLLLPGPISDFLGLLLLFSPSRRLVSGLLRRWAARKVKEGSLHIYHHHVGPSEHAGSWHPGQEHSDWSASLGDEPPVFRARHLESDAQDTRNSRDPRSGDSRSSGDSKESRDSSGTRVIEGQGYTVEERRLDGREKRDGEGRSQDEDSRDD